MYPEHPVANMCFKVYGYISMTQALTFVADFKLGHYMKIPPRAMFMAQVSLVSLSSPEIPGCFYLRTRQFKIELNFIAGGRDTSSSTDLRGNDDTNWKGEEKGNGTG